LGSPNAANFLDSSRTNVEHIATKSARHIPGYRSRPRPSAPENPDRLEAAIDQAIAACDGDLRGTIRALIVANEFLESEVCELMAAVSHAYTRGRFHTYSG
jgi:hypothetical protein